MTTGRTLAEFERIYIDGYDLSGYVMDTGERGVGFEEFDAAALSDPINGCLVGKPTVTLGPVNGVFDNTATSGHHVLATAAQGARRNVMVAIGVRGVPAFGDDVFAAPMYQLAYKGIPGSGVSTARIDFGGPDVTVGLNYDEFWGKLIHAYGAETAANSANTNIDNLASSAAGGWMMYHIRSITGSGTVTISIDDSSTGTSGWAGVSGLTSGAIATASAPTSGVVQIATTATIKRYIRWQIAFGGSASACTFVLGIFRGR